MARKLANEARNYVGKNWSVSSLTREKLLGNLERISAYMEGQGLQSISHLKTKHVEGFFRALEQRGLSASTRANYATAMRALAAGIGKQNVVPRTNEELGISRADRYAPKTADLERMAEIREQLYQRETWQGLAFELQQTFGLRLKESLLSHRTVERNGELRLVIEGAKGGRPRELAVDTPEKRALVERLQEHLRENRQRGLIPPERTLLQGYHRQKNDLYRLGARKAAGANSHLARHACAQEMKRGGATDREVAEHLGHSREEVTRHYQ